ncbi:biopolymer transporter ExbD [Rapidithrix thailandica]|uniref:Biopolymer transporter ExbD n=1 Tax=Rapidithrix thailandica TaxID=413964 RepID=A0AAW9SCY3_9BACT
MGRKNREETTVNASSMADIAFLLLIFFLVTTTIASDKGIAVLLPPKKEDQQDVKINQRNIFKVLVNSSDRLLVEEEPTEVEEIREKVKKFVTNNGKDPKLSESPDKAVVSLKTDRGTSYEMYIRVYDELKRAYNELRAAHVGLTLEQFNELDPKDPDQNELLERAKKAYKIQISDAEPTDVGN